MSRVVQECLFSDCPSPAWNYDHGILSHAAAMCWRRRPLLTVPPSIPEGSMCPPWYHDFSNKEPSNITQTPTQEAVRPPNANQVYPPPDRALIKESPTP